MSTHPVLTDFHPIVRAWFERTYGEPTPPQVLGWPSISAGEHTLILAPTGSGKTLAAFLWAINHLVEQHLAGDLDPGVRILYVSPLKALNNDIERNLESPLQAIRDEAHRTGHKLPIIRSAVRTGDTPQSRRTAMLKHPPDILITTPESLYLMLTSKQARNMFRTVQYIIIDEIHSVCGNKRGVHLSVSLERLQEIATQELIRIGLSATQRPLEKVAEFLGGFQWEGETLAPRRVNIIDAGRKKTMDLRVECAAPDFSLLPQESVWPLIFTDILEKIRRHKTTLIFVNNRRLAERVAAKLNEMVAGDDNDGAAAGRNFNLYAVPMKMTGPDSPGLSEPVAAAQPASPFVQAYHGSMSRHAREQMERDLKDGKLRALVTTSSLELGIDIGSIDLVVQLQSPKGVARGLQRVGRSGHLITAESKGRILPSHREDLVESAVVARAMLEHDVEMTTIPTDCLDVLAQQIVAMVSIEEWDTDGLFRLVRRSACYRDLSRTLYAGVLQMLAGRYTDEAFRELRPRISWDKVNNTLRALPGSGRLAVTSGGTIADRGYFGVYIEDRKTRVGEVDEEFVYETRTGDTFILGSNVWRVIEMDANRLIVRPAPGQAARMPFWRGEGIGRSFELGKKIGEFRRAMASRADGPDCLQWLQREYPIDSRAAWNIQEYFRRQQTGSGSIPHDHLVLVEGFRDEIGDPRIVVHSSYGRRVNGLLGLVLAHRLQAMTGVESQMLYNDDGILFRCPDRDVLPLHLFDGLTAQEGQDLVLEELLSSPLFGGQFRQNAARALLMPKMAPGKRTPLWLQRLRAADLLQVARRYSDFPIVIETVREVLNDVLDFQHCTEILRALESGAIRVQTVQTEVPSPFTASLLFDFIAVYMYEWDQPRADRQSQYLAVNRELLAEIVDLESAPSLLRPEAIDSVEQYLQHVSTGTRARSPEELMELLIRVGDLTEEEIVARCDGDGRAMLHELAADGRAVPVFIANGTRWIAGEEKTIYQSLDAEDHARHVLGRYIQSHGPVTSSELAQRFGFQPERVEAIARNLERNSSLLRGRFRPSGLPSSGEEQWCYRPTMERIHRQTISILRREITPSSPGEFTGFLLHWQHVNPAARMTAAEGLEECLAQLQGLPLPSEIWEREILRSRLRDYGPAAMNELASRGIIVWAGAGPGRMKCLFRGEAGYFLPTEADEDALGAPARRILEYLRHNGASFYSDLRSGGNLSLSAINAGIGELFWDGWVTNDVFTELTGIRRSTRMAQDAPVERVELVLPLRSPGRSRIVQTARKAIRQVPGWTGRWSLVRSPGVLGSPGDEEEIAARQAAQLLQRYGIVAREFYRREDLLPWPLVALQFQRMEMRGEIRRGYFIQGLSGMQYALPAAVDELRRLKSEQVERQPVIVINACDPANIYGPGIELPGRGEGQPAPGRLPGNFVALCGGTPILWIENLGGKIWTIGRPETEQVTEALTLLADRSKLPPQIRPFREIILEYWDGERPARTAWAGVLRQLGFKGGANQTMRYDGYA
jgi:ATP-dependent Lhr-like helicase